MKANGMVAAAEPAVVVMTPFAVPMYVHNIAREIFKHNRLTSFKQNRIHRQLRYFGFQQRLLSKLYPDHVNVDGFNHVGSSLTKGLFLVEKCGSKCEVSAGGFGFFWFVRLVLHSV